MKMTIRWFRRACDGTVQFVENKPQEILRRNWRALNAFHVTRLRVLARADELTEAINKAI